MPSLAAPPTARALDDSRVFSDLPESEQVEFVRGVWLNAQGKDTPRWDEYFLDQYRRVMYASNLSTFVDPLLWRPNTWSLVTRFWSKRSRLTAILGIVSSVIIGLSQPQTLQTGLIIGSVLVLAATSVFLGYASRLRRSIDDRPDLAAWGAAIQKAILKEVNR